MKLPGFVLLISITIFFSFYTNNIKAQPAGSPVYYEGKIYNTLILGSYCWMTENLNVGTIISGATMPSNDGVIEKICFNDNPAMCDTFGGMYRWDELMDYQLIENVQGICPVGWHIPNNNGDTSLNDWYHLTNYNNNPDEADPELIIGGVSGFDAVKGGYANNLGGFYQNGIVGAYWSSTKISYQAYRRSFDGIATVGQFITNKSDAYSVRCMRNSLTEIIPFNISVIGEDAHCNSSSTGKINLLVSGTSNPSFLWSNGSTIEDLTGLSLGIYYVTVTEGVLSLTDSVYISEPSEIITSISVNNAISCFGGSDGIGVVLVSGGISPYSYIWSDGQTNATATNLSVGSYYVTVVDANGCMATDSVYLDGPVQQVFFTSDITNVNCFDDNSGIIDITPQIAGSILYTWSNYQVSQDIYNLTAGSYSVTVTQVYNCTVNQFEITQPDQIDIISQVINPTGQGFSDGSIDLSISGGITPYTYNWSTGSTNEDLTGLAAGSYFVTVTDANQCSELSGQINLTPPGIEVVYTLASPISCNGLNDGSIFVYATGNGSLSYSIDTGTVNYVGYFDGLSAGSYSITISDLQGSIEIVNNLIVTEPDPLSYNVIQEPGCAGANVTIMAVGGTPPYSYSNDVYSYQSSSMFLNYPPGNTNFTITDSEGCEFSQFVNVNSYDVFTINEVITGPLCNGSDDGSILLNVSYPMSPVNYIWSNGNTTNYISNLEPGDYTVTVTNGNSCAITEVFYLADTYSISVYLVGVDITIQGGSNGAIITNVLHGTPPYTYLWSNGDTTQNIDSLGVGAYFVTVTDSNNCTQTSSIALFENNTNQLLLYHVINNVECFGQSNGEIEIDIYTTNPPYNVLWTTGDITTKISNLSAGVYYVTVIDQYQQITDSFIVSQNVELVVDILITDYSGFPISYSGSSDGGIGLEISGGVSPYDINWSTGETTDTIGNLVAGNYTVTVSDASNFPEPLPQDWYFTHTAFNHSIVIPFGTEILIDGVQLDSGSWIGVFYDSLGTMACGSSGVDPNSSIFPFDVVAGTYYYGVDSVYAIAAWQSEPGQNNGFMEGENFNWFVWRASDSIMVPMEAVLLVGPSSFVPNGTTALGSLSQEMFSVFPGCTHVETISIYPPEGQNIILQSGWSLISSYINPFQPDMDSVFSSVVSDLVICKDGDGNSYWPVYGVNMIGDLTLGEGYQIKMLANDTLIIEGFIIEPDTVSINLPYAWSILGYLRISPASISNMLFSIVSDIAIVKDDDGNNYWPAYGVDQIVDMVPGEGYQIKMNSAQTFTYPANSNTYLKTDLIISKPQYYQCPENTGANMTLGLHCNSIVIGSEIGVFNQSGLLIGAGVAEGDFIAISLWGNDELTREIDGLIVGEEFEIRVWESGNHQERKLFVDEWIEGSNIFNVNKIAIAGSSHLEDIDNFKLFQNTPNPFSHETEFSFYLPKDCKVEFEIFNLLGEKVVVLLSERVLKGKHSIIFNKNDLPAGTYYYRLKTSEFEQSQKMILVKE